MHSYNAILRNEKLEGLESSFPFIDASNAYDENPSPVNACDESPEFIKREFNFDSLLTESLGEFGFFQKMLVCLLCLPACVFSAYNNYDMVFLAYTPDHRCKIVSENEEAVGRCAVKYTLNQSSQNMSSCDEWIYDSNYFDQTLVTEWDLVCHREIIIRNIISLTWVAGLFSMLLSYVQDQWGRKIACILNMAIVTTANLLTVFTSDLYWFTALKCIGSLSCLFNIGLCWSLEFVGPSKRTLVATVLSFGYAIATSSMVIWARVGRSWRQLTLIYHTPFLLVLVYCFWLPESPRWLLTRGEFDRCAQVLSQMARWNGAKLDKAEMRGMLERRGKELNQSNGKCPADTLDKRWPKSVNGHVMEFLKNSNLRLKLILLGLITAIGTQIYTAVPFHIENLPSDFLLSFLVQSLVEPPAMLISMYVLNRFGRIWPLTFFTSLGGLICLLNWPLGHSTPWASMMLSSLARFFICISVPVSSQLANELFPTVVRGMGTSALEFLHSVVSISVQYILYSRNHWEPLPMVLMGSLAFFSGLFALFLPETKDKPLPDTLGEAEKIGKVDFATFRLNLSRIFYSRRTTTENTGTSTSNTESINENNLILNVIQPNDSNA